MSDEWWVAIDLGASSARVVAATWDQPGVRVRERELGRVPNRPVLLPDGLHWDLTGLLAATLEVITQEIQRAGAPSTIAVDGWGVDYGLLDADGRLLGLPYHYRDSRTEGCIRQVADRVPAMELYRRTGIQTLPINTLYQLVAERGNAAYREASWLVLIPDLFTYFLTGEIGAELTNASTTQLLDLKGGWSADLLARLGLRHDMLPPLVEPGSRRGPVRTLLANDLGWPGGAEVVSVASHDTASAVAAIPAESAEVAYVVAGTWSLVGVELAEPVVSAAAAAENFTNERGIEGTVRFLKNVMGFWLQQECERSWGHPVNLPPEEILALPDPFVHAFDPDLTYLLGRGRDMPQRIQQAIGEMGAVPPTTATGISLAIVASLALSYARVVRAAEHLAGHTVRVIHLVGGGSQSEVLCQLTADATGRDVVAGPVEASALGNLLMQRVAAGDVRDRWALREVVRRSVVLRTYRPRSAQHETAQAALAGFTTRGGAAHAGDIVGDRNGSR